MRMLLRGTRMKNKELNIDFESTMTEESFISIHLKQLHACNNDNLDKLEATIFVGNFTRSDLFFAELAFLPHRIRECNNWHNNPDEASTEGLECWLEMLVVVHAHRLEPSESSVKLKKRTFNEII